jgi:lysozyme
MVKDRLSDRFLAVDGRLGSATLAAIGEFQRRHSLPQNGLIKRGDATIRALASFSGPRSMRASSDLVRAVEAGEEFGAVPYNDAHKPPNATIGYGHKLHSGAVTDADRKKWGPNGISTTRAEEILRQDISGKENEINTDVRVPLRQSQFDALVSLTLNIGNDGFRRSTLLRLLNLGDYEGAANEFPHWERSGSAYPKGLPPRRREEQERFRRR